MEEKMNWLLILLLVVTILSVIAGYYRGFVRTAISMVFMILVLILSGWLSPYIGKALEEHTPVAEGIHDACRNMVAEMLEEQSGSISANGEMEQQELLNMLGLPAELLGGVLSTEQLQTGQEEAIQVFAEQTADVLTNLAVDAIVFLVSFAAAWIVVCIVRRVADIFTELPVLGFVNRVCGGVLGMIRALFWVWIFFLVLTVFSGTEWGNFCLQAIREDSVLLFLYRNNLILKFLLGAF